MVVIFPGADFLGFKDPEFAGLDRFLGIKFGVEIVNGMEVTGGPVVDAVFVKEGESGVLVYGELLRCKTVRSDGNGSGSGVGEKGRWSE